MVPDLGAPFDVLFNPAVQAEALHRQQANGDGSKLVDHRPSCRNAILDAIDQLHQRTGATQFARRAVVAEVQAAGGNFARQTIYRCLRRMTGHEPGSAHHDLEDLGANLLRLRA